MFIAFGLSACVESDIKNPDGTSTSAEALTAGGSEDGEKANQVPTLKELSSVAKTPITQAQFDSIVAATPEGQPVVIKRRSGYLLEIGNENHPELLTLEFVDCEFEEGLYIINKYQAIMNLRRCVMRILRLESNGVVQMMSIKRSRITELSTNEGGRCNDLTLTGAKITSIINDMGNSNDFKFIHFSNATN